MNSDLIDLRNAYITRLEAFDKDGAVQYALSLLESGEISVPTLYEQILAPALNQIVIPRCNEDSMIWKEHIMSNIVRTTIEAAYPFVHREREKAGNKNRDTLVVLACPQEEYHEIGVRMGADYFTMRGYKVVYIGCNTPRDTLLDAVKTLKPAIVTLGVTCCLNLVQLPVLVAAIKTTGSKPAVYLSGSALDQTGNRASDFGADGFLSSFASVQALPEGEKP